MTLTHTHDHTTEEMRGQLTTIESVKRFMFAGSATITFESRKTDGHFTYKIDEVENQSPTQQPRYFIKLLSGQDNESDYTYMGMLVPDGPIVGNYKFTTTRASKVGLEAPSVVALNWVLTALATYEYLPSVLSVWHEGRCGRCGRKLTVPESIANGIGPECMRQMGGL
jgi:hypothetical protein